MDHSYRAVNGNVADSPPSTIEFRNGNVNGNGHYKENIAPWEAPPPPVREDAPTRIYLFIEDLFFFAKINEAARKLGIKVAFVKNDPETLAKITEGPEEERPSLIVFDLNNAAAKPMTLIPKIKSKLKRGTSVIGFLSHLQGDLKAKAVEAGCDMVMPRSAFSQNLPTLLRRHGLDGEQETEFAQT
jgi:PleD family two-component response regulator